MACTNKIIKFWNSISTYMVLCWKWRDLWFMTYFQSDKLNTTQAMPAKTFQILLIVLKNLHTHTLFFFLLLIVVVNVAADNSIQSQ